MSGSASTTTRKICNRLLVLCAAMTMGLVGCYPEFPDPIGSVQFEGDSLIEANSGSLLAVKPPNSAPSTAIAHAGLRSSITNLPGVANDSSLQVAEQSGGALNAEVPDSASSESSEDSEDSAAREVDDEGKDEDDSECQGAERFGSISVEIDGPSAAFMDDNIVADVKIVIYNDSANNADKVQLSIHLSKDEILDDTDLILTQPRHIVAGPGSFSELQADPGPLQPLAGINSGDYHIIVRIDAQDHSAQCSGADNVSSFPLQVI